MPPEYAATSKKNVTTSMPPERPLLPRTLSSHRKKAQRDHCYERARCMAARPRLDPKGIAERPNIRASGHLFGTNTFPVHRQHEATFGPSSCSLDARVAPRRVEPTAARPLSTPASHASPEVSSNLQEVGPTLGRQWLRPLTMDRQPCGEQLTQKPLARLLTICLTHFATMWTARRDGSRTGHPHTPQSETHKKTRHSYTAAPRPRPVSRVLNINETNCSPGLLMSQLLSVGSP